MWSYEERVGGLGQEHSGEDFSAQRRLERAQRDRDALMSTRFTSTSATPAPRRDPQAEWDNETDAAPMLAAAVSESRRDLAPAALCRLAGAGLDLADAAERLLAQAKELAFNFDEFMAVAGRARDLKERAIEFAVASLREPSADQVRREFPIFLESWWRARTRIAA